ncbi:MAG: DUF4080 domain-containing protein [Spirochaetales bacterium]|nr:DUF4080 domain-containing protein [Spirochaetales bacterium]
MKIIFVTIHNSNNAHAVPLGSAYIASYLKSKISDIEVKILEFYLSDNQTKITESITKESPDVVAFSVYIWNHITALATAKALQQVGTETLLIAGGPEISGDLTRLDDSPFDFLIQGEGELPFYNLINQLNSGMSKDLIYQQSGKFIPAEYIEDLSQIPSPFLTKLIHPGNYKGMLLQLSRGCPFKCSFCYEAGGKSGVRYFPEERIHQELTSFVAAGIEQVFVLDPTFNCNKERTIRMINLMLDAAPDIHYSLEIRAEFIDEDIANLLSMLNCSVQIGVQSIKQETLKNINRKFNPSQFKKQIGILEEYGIIYGFDIIYGLPGDNFLDILEGIDFALSLRPNTLDIFPLAILPGTVLEEKAEEFKLEYLKKPPYTITATPNLCAEELKKAKLIKQACDSLYNTAGAVTWLNLVAEYCKRRPSEIIEEFIPFMKKGEKDYKLVETIKLSIVSFLEKRKIEKKTIELISDIITFFGYTQILLKNDQVDVETPQVIMNYTCEELTYNIDQGIADFDLLRKYTTYRQSKLAFILTPAGFITKNYKLNRERPR